MKKSQIDRRRFMRAAAAASALPAAAQTPGRPPAENKE